MLFRSSIACDVKTFKLLLSTVATSSSVIVSLKANKKLTAVVNASSIVNSDIKRIFKIAPIISVTASIPSPINIYDAFTAIPYYNVYSNKVDYRILSTNIVDERVL